MTTPMNKADDGVHRLVDMVVEEVSLVDRAANKHRFLIVKRDEAMDDDKTQNPTPAEPSPPAVPTAKLDDNSALNAALAREVRLVGTYRAAVELANEDDKVALALILDHHIAYANAFKGLLGTQAREAAETPMLQPSGGFDAMASALANLENQSAKSHVDMLAGLKGLDASALVASIVTVTVRTATALSIAAGAAPLAAAGA